MSRADVAWARKHVYERNGRRKIRELAEALRDEWHQLVDQAGKEGLAEGIGTCPLLDFIEPVLVLGEDELDALPSLGLTDQIDKGSAPVPLKIGQASKRQMRQEASDAEIRRAVVRRCHEYWGMQHQDEATE